MYPHRLLIAIGLAAFIGSLVVFAPLQTVVKLTPKDSTLQSVGFEGTLLDGRVRTATRAGDIVWTFQLRPLRLLTLGLGFDWQVVGADIKAHGDAAFRPWGFSATVETGEVAANRLGGMLGGDGFETDQPLFLRDVSVRGLPGPGLRGAEGVLVWGPGEVRLRDRPQPLSVPALSGQLQTKDNKVELLVGSESSPEVALMTGTLDLQTRELHVVVLGRALRLLGVDSQFADEKPAFELRQPLR